MSNEIRILFSNKLEKLRQELGLSQEKFAEKCSVDRTYIGRLERMERTPRLHVLYLMSKNLGIDLIDLLNFNDVNSASRK